MHQVYDKIMRLCVRLVPVGEEIEKTYGIPIINKRISVTPIAMLAASANGDPVMFAKTLEKAARETGVNFIGGFSALVQKGFSAGDRELIGAIPQALAETDHVCSRSTSDRRRRESTWMPSVLWDRRSLKARS